MCIRDRLHTNERVDFVYADYYFIDENNNISRSMCNPQPNMLNRGNCIGPCFLYGKKVCEETGDYDPEFFLVEDYEYWLRVRKKFKMKKINDCLYYFRLHPLSLSLSTNTSLVKKQMEKVRRKHIYTSIRSSQPKYRKKWIERKIRKTGKVRNKGKGNT